MSGGTVRVYWQVATGVLRGVIPVVATEVAEGRGLCLFNLHSWWDCAPCAENGRPHKVCRRCGASSPEESGWG